MASLNKMPMSVRLAFNFKKWQPTEHEWCNAIIQLQPEERQRIQKFRYRDDAKASLVGRLFIKIANHNGLFPDWPMALFNLEFGPKTLLVGVIGVKKVLLLIWKKFWINNIKNLRYLHSSEKNKKFLFWRCTVFYISFKQFDLIG